MVDLVQVEQEDVEQQELLTLEVEQVVKVEEVLTLLKQVVQE
jgi:hypothetical protein